MFITANQTSGLTTIGAQDAAKRTYASVKKALDAHPGLRAKGVEVFLQGSYANSTNIRSDSDVDIVVMLPQTYVSDTSRLTPIEKARYDNSWIPASYSSSHLRQDVTNALVSYYGTGRVKAKNKCVRVLAADGYVDADVVPAIQYRLFRSFISSPGDYIEGTAIHPLNGGLVINYPKEHKKNGESKNLLTFGNFKPTVRQIKNLKRHAVKQGLLKAEDAPGYLLECMTYNIPPQLFEKNDHFRLGRAFDWLLSADYSNFMSVDEVHQLFRTDPGKFSAITARNVLNTLASQVKWA